MFDLLLIAAFLLICLYVLHPSKQQVMLVNALLPLYDLQQNETLPALCKKIKCLDA